MNKGRGAGGEGAGDWSPDGVGEWKMLWGGVSRVRNCL